MGICNAYGARNPDWVVNDEEYIYGKDPGSDGSDRDRLGLVLSVRSFLLFLPSFSYTFNF